MKVACFLIRSTSIRDVSWNEPDYFFETATEKNWNVDIACFPNLTTKIIKSACFLIRSTSIHDVSWNEPDYFFETANEKNWNVHIHQFLINEEEISWNWRKEKREFKPKLAKNSGIPLLQNQKLWK